MSLTCGTAPTLPLHISACTWGGLPAHPGRHRPPQLGKCRPPHISNTRLQASIGPPVSLERLQTHPHHSTVTSWKGWNQARSASGALRAAMYPVSFSPVLLCRPNLTNVTSNCSLRKRCKGAKSVATSTAQTLERSVVGPAREQQAVAPVLRGLQQHSTAWHEDGWG